jgi:hypothetical protein
MASWLGFRVKRVEDRIAPSRRQSFVIVIDGMVEDEQGNYTVPYVEDPEAEVIEVRATPETVKWLAEQAELTKEREAKREAEPWLEDYAVSEGVPLPEEYVAPKPEPNDDVVTIPGGRMKRTRRGIFPADWSQAEETVQEMLERLGY